MGFATPWFLTGIVAIGLPVSIHLLAQNRSLPRQFSSLMFFEQRVQASVKYRRLRYLLLLALRVTLLVLMAIAFANPFVTPGGASASWGKLMVLAIDDSFSMRYGDHFSKAKDAALKTVSLLRPQDRAQAIALDSHVYFLTQQTADREQLRAAIRGMQVSDARSSYAELCHALCVLDKSAHQPLEVHFFTDAQRSSMPASFADLRLGDRTRLLVHAVGSGSEPNWTVESVTAPSRIYSSKSARVQAVVAGFNTPAVQKTVSLVVDGKVLESKQVSVPENGRAPVEFASLASPYGFHRGEVRIESHDPLPNDDRFPFAVERAELSPILFLHQARSTRDVLYFKTAIESVEEAGFVVEPVAVEQAPRQSLSKYGFVVLSDVGVLPRGFEDELRRYVNSGGSVLIALGPGAESSRTIPIFDEALGSEVSHTSAQTVASVDPEYPPLRDAGNLEGVTFDRAIDVQAGPSLVAARLTGQTPLLLEKRLGEGRVLLFTSTLDGTWNDLPLRPAFLPFVEHTARYLAGHREGSSNMAVDSSVDLRAAASVGAAADVVDPDGKHVLSLRQASSAQTFQFDREGFYEIHPANGREELIAVHADRGESDLTAIPPEALTLWRNTGSAGNSERQAAEDAHARRQSLWRYALLAVLLLAITESLMASRYAFFRKEAA